MRGSPLKLFRFFPAVSNEEFVWLDLIDPAERDELHEAGIGLFTRFETRDVSLRNPAATIRGRLRHARHLTHRQFVSEAQFVQFFGECHTGLLIP